MPPCCCKYIDHKKRPVHLKFPNRLAVLLFTITSVSFLRNSLLKYLFIFILTTLASLNLLAKPKSMLKPKRIYKSKTLEVIQLSNNTFQHISYLVTNDFGKVPCNGLVVRSKNECLVFDTPTNDESSEELIHWIEQKLKCTIKAVVPTHFHNDCLGGLTAFHKHHINSYASDTTLKLAKLNQYVLPLKTFNDSIQLLVGNEIMLVKFFGEGHTKDNVVAYFPSESVLFGGCLIKEINATKGYLGDANINAWSKTVERVKQAFPDVKIVVPGHGRSGNSELLNYTIHLFKTEN